MKELLLAWPEISKPASRVAVRSRRSQLPLLERRLWRLDETALCPHQGPRWPCLFSLSFNETKLTPHPAPTTEGRQAAPTSPDSAPWPSEQLSGTPPHPPHPLSSTHTPMPQPIPTTFRTYISFRCRRSWPESGLSGLGVGRGLLAFISPLGSHICCIRDMNTVHREKSKWPCDFPTVREMQVQARRDTVPHLSGRRKFTRLTAFCWRGCGEGRP